MKRYLLVALACLPATPAFADKLYDACVDKTPNNFDWSQCGEAYVRRADATLNAAWQHTYGLAKGRTRADLLKEQRAWIAYKDASCAYYSNGDWGREGQVLDFFSCRAEVIRQRTAELVGTGKFIAGE